MTRSEAARRAHERRREADEMIEREIGEALVWAWRAIGPRGRASHKATPYMTRGEAFAHWCHDHSAECLWLTVAAQEASGEAWDAPEAPDAPEWLPLLEEPAYEPESIGAWDVDGTDVVWLDEPVALPVARAFWAMAA